jgi:regulator of nucleoside diphosphate kinase
MQHKETFITDLDQRRLRSYLADAAPGDERDAEHLDFLRRRLDCAQVVKPNEIPLNVVTMHSVVALRNLDSGDRLTCRLAYPHEARRSLNNLCVSRPLGTAVLGARVGQIIRWPSGRRDRRMRIQQVLYQPEAAGDFHL